MNYLSAASPLHSSAASPLAPLRDGGGNSGVHFDARIMPISSPTPYGRGTKGGGRHV